MVLGSFCFLARLRLEISKGLLFGREPSVWLKVASPTILPLVVPSVDVAWKHLSSLLPKDKMKALDSLFALIIWHLWLERNARLVGEEKMTSAQLTAKIEQEAIAWIGAGAKDLGSLLVAS
jgi:hypothetical protein